jgi:hypothetical protein
VAADLGYLKFYPLPERGLFMTMHQAPTKILFDDLAAAASQLPKMKRAPAGSRGIIPSDTLLSPDREGLLVETSVISTFIPADEPWQITASVDARKLVAICKTIKEIGAAGEMIEISVEEREMWFKFRTTKFSIPTLWVKGA